MKSLLIFFSTSILLWFGNAAYKTSDKSNPSAAPMQSTTSQANIAIDSNSEREKKKVQVALLLDTSGSMDGLIEQAKSQLWNIVNTITTLKDKGEEPKVEIALYEYGNDGLSSRNNFIRQITPLTDDLDLISEKLFSLKTNGGSEYCGAVINDAHKTLQWRDGNENMKLIYIAGNESFDQGPIDYRNVVKSAREDDIYVNTIFCGSGEDRSWYQGANLGGGKYFQINSDREISYIETPYDDAIDKLNSKLNETYIGYGSMGVSKKENQIMQDANAESQSKSNKVERTVSKSKKVYSNSSWDVVDLYTSDSKSYDKLIESELPEELKNKDKATRDTYIKAKVEERAKIQKKISELSLKRDKYIKEEQNKKGEKDDLGNAINGSILEFAKLKGYEVGK